MTNYVRNGTEGADTVKEFDWDTDDYVSSRLYGGEDYFYVPGAAYLVYGGDGDDQLHGGHGGGTSYGGAGNDMLAAYWGVGNIDRMYGGVGNDDFYGPISETMDGHHYFYGGDGVDFFAPNRNGGDDHVFGGSGYDVLITLYKGTEGVGLSLATGGFSGTYAAGDTYSGVEGVKGTRYADQIAGNEASNAIVGERGADVLQGAGGDDLLIGYDFTGFFDVFTGRNSPHPNRLSITDTEAFAYTPGLDDSAADQLFGGAGNDVLIGGFGGDVLDGGTGVDTASYVESTQAVTVNLSTDVLSGGSAAGDTLTSIENLFGSKYADSLTGDGYNNRLRGELGNDALYGGGGADVLEGGRGNDLIDGGAGNDTVTYVGATGAVTVNLALTAPQNTVGAGIDTLSSMQNLNGSDRFGDTLQGGVVNNRINGLGGNDTVRGGGGADSVLGWIGDDVLYGEAGADLLTGGSGADTFAYAAISDSGALARDRIADFGAGDKFDLSAIDANGDGEGEGVFTRVDGDGAFTAAGQLRLTLSGADTLLELNTDADDAPEAVIVITGVYNQAGVEGGWLL